MPEKRLEGGKEEEKGDLHGSMACDNVVGSPSPYLSYYVFPTGLANIQRDSRLVSLRM